MGICGDLTLCCLLLGAGNMSGICHENYISSSREEDFCDIVLWVFFCILFLGLGWPFRIVTIFLFSFSFFHFSVVLFFSFPFLPFLCHVLGSIRHSLYIYRLAGGSARKGKPSL